VQVAVLLDRAAVIPDLPCATSWLHHPEREAARRCSTPLNLTQHTNSIPYAYPPALVHGREPHKERTIKIATAEFLDDACQQGFAGSLTDPEWCHWQLSHDVNPGGVGARLMPGDNNTILAPIDALKAELGTGLVDGKAADPGKPPAGMRLMMVNAQV
jgi:hypothetical protein